MKKSNQPVLNPRLERLKNIVTEGMNHQSKPFDLATLVRPNIWNLTPYSSARHEFEGRAEVYLDANENPFNNGMNRYPDPLQRKVKEPLATIKGVRTDQLFLGNGSDEPIDLLLRIFCEPGRDAILTVPPTYGMYQVSADINNVSVKKVLLTNDFQLNVDDILAAADEHTKLLFLCSPNNPTGNSVDRAAIEHLVRQFSGIVVIDEAYIDFAKQESCVPFIDQFPNVVVLQTFSKAWGMANIRLGMAFAPTPIIDLFNKVKPPYNINELTQKAALLAFKHQDKVQEAVQKIIAERERLAQALPHFSFVETVFPSDANFLLVKVRQPKKLYDYLAARGIVVRDRSKVALCEGCLRFTVGKKAENERLVNALGSYEIDRN